MERRECHKGTDRVRTLLLKGRTAVGKGGHMTKQTKEEEEMFSWKPMNGRFWKRKDSLLFFPTILKLSTIDMDSKSPLG